jgi:hypothetical protein
MPLNLFFVTHFVKILLHVLQFFFFVIYLFDYYFSQSVKVVTNEKLMEVRKTSNVKKFWSQTVVIDVLLPTS